MRLFRYLSVFLVLVCFSTQPSYAVLALSKEAIASDKIDYLKGIDSSILLLSDHDGKLYDGGLNSVFGSAYQLLNQANHSILIINYAYDNLTILEILNRKAAEGLDVTVVYDRDRGKNLIPLLHPEIKKMTRKTGEGHMHHKIIVVDRDYNWISSANFNSINDKNIAVVYRSPENAEVIYNECYYIDNQHLRDDMPPLLVAINSQYLEFYILPHNDPQRPKKAETQMNEAAKQKLLSLISEAKESIRVSMVVWTYKDSARALVEAANRGVKVEVVYANIDREVLMILQKGNVSLHQAHSPFHHKLMEIDDRIVWNGSANWTMNAFSRTDDSVTVLYDLNPDQVLLMDEAWRDLVSRC